VASYSATIDIGQEYGLNANIPPPRSEVNAGKPFSGMNGQIGALSGRELRRLARQAVRCRAVREVERRFGLLHELVAPVIGGNPFELLAVLVGDEQVVVARRRPDGVSLACAARAHLGPEAADRPSLGGIEEDHVARGHEADDGVRVAMVVEHEHVRPHGVGAGLGQAERRRLGPEIDDFRRRAGGMRPQLIGIVDVERAAERLAVRVGLIEQPDFVIEAARDARRVQILGRWIEERHTLVGWSIPRQPARAVIAQRQRQRAVRRRGRRALRLASGARGQREVGRCDERSGCRDHRGDQTGSERSHGKAPLLRPATCGRAACLHRLETRRVGLRGRADGARGVGGVERARRSGSRRDASGVRYNAATRACRLPVAQRGHAARTGARPRRTD
jgi:hypothetical protein